METLKATPVIIGIPTITMSPRKSHTPQPSSSFLNEESLSNSPTKSPSKSPTKSFANPLDETTTKSSIKSSDISTKFPVPPKWIDHGLEGDWNHPDSNGSVVAHAFGLGPGRPILEDEQGQIMIFESGKKFYLWDEMNNEIYEFACQDLGEIYHALHNGGLRKLNRWLLEEVGDLTH